MIKIKIFIGLVFNGDKERMQMLIDNHLLKGSPEQLDGRWLIRLSDQSLAVKNSERKALDQQDPIVTLEKCVWNTKTNQLDIVVEHITLSQLRDRMDPHKNGDLKTNLLIKPTTPEQENLNLDKQNDPRYLTLNYVQQKASDTIDTFFPKLQADTRSGSWGPPQYTAIPTPSEQNQNTNTVNENQRKNITRGNG